MMGRWARRWKLTLTSLSVTVTVGGHVDEVAEDLAGLGVGVAAHRRASRR